MGRAFGGRAGVRVLLRHRYGQNVSGDNHDTMCQGSVHDTVVDACKAQGVPEPEYEVNGGFVSIVFRRATEKTMDEGVNRYVNGPVNGELNGELNPSQKATLKFIMEHEGCTASEISKKTSIPFSTIDKHIRVLLKVGVIERRGSKKTGGYYPVGKK